MATGTATSERELVIEKLLNAPKELVWKVFSEPDHIKNWWGPNGFTNTIFRMEFKPEGVWDFIMHGPDGRDYKNKNIFKEVIKPERIVYEHVSTPKHVTTITFTEQENKTLLKWRMVFATAEELENVIKIFKADVGLKQNVDKLEKYLSGFVETLTTKDDQRNNDPLVLERTFNAPVEKVWQALTDVDQMRKWYFDLEEFKSEPGFEFQFSAGEEFKPYMHICKVTEVIQNKKLTYSWRYEGYEGNSFVTFELFQEGEKTKLKLTHTGLQTFPVSNPDFAKENFAHGWDHIIGKSLKEFLEK